MSSSVTWPFLRYQVPTITAMVGGAIRSYLPKTASGRPVHLTRPAPADALVDAFADWAQAAPGQYRTSLPPTLVTSQLALALIARLTAESPYPMLRVLNQGVQLQLNAPLPRHEALTLSGRLVDARDDGYRARVHVQVQVGTVNRPDALVIDSYAAVPLKKRPARTAPPIEEPRFETLATWQAAADEGQTFFHLTGDFNPIHTWPWLARKTAFKGCILHGYGAFSQVFEALQRAGHHPTWIDLRFLNPLPLPSPQLQIQLTPEADADGVRRFRLCDAQGTVYQAGRLRTQTTGGVQ